MLPWPARRPVVCFGEEHPPGYFTTGAGVTSRAWFSACIIIIVVMVFAEGCFLIKLNQIESSGEAVQMCARPLDMDSFGNPTAGPSLGALSGPQSALGLCIGPGQGRWGRISLGAALDREGQALEDEYPGNLALG